MRGTAGSRASTWGAGLVAIRMRPYLLTSDQDCSTVSTDHKGDRDGTAKDDADEEEQIERIEQEHLVRRMHAYQIDAVRANSKGSKKGEGSDNTENELF